MTVDSPKFVFGPERFELHVQPGFEVFEQRPRTQLPLLVTVFVGEFEKLVFDQKQPLKVSQGRGRFLGGTCARPNCDRIRCRINVSVRFSQGLLAFAAAASLGFLAGTFLAGFFQAVAVPVRIVIAFVAEFRL